MKLFYLFLAVVAATETTVSSVETTASVTVTESSVADVVETTATATVTESTGAEVDEATAADTDTESTVADVVEASDVEDGNIDDQEDGEDDQEEGENDQLDCDGAKAFIIRAKQGLEEQELAEMSKDPENPDVWKFLENTCTEICVAEGKNCYGIEFAYDNDFVCKEAKSALEAASTETEKTEMKTACDLACADVEGQTCGVTTVSSVETTASVTVTESTAAVDDAALAACKDAQKTLAATTNSLEKVALTAACELACTDVENETCGFLVNGLSFVLFVILAVFKY